jgi:hypothetical protein
MKIVNVLNEIEGLAIKRIWLDAEDEAAESYPVSENISSIRNAIAVVRAARPDLAIGIYSGAGWWRANTGNYQGQDICSLPLWFANYRNPEFVTDYRSLLFGGWKTAAMWQYAGTINTAGWNTDRNIILEDDVADLSNYYNKAEVDAKIGALLGLEIDLGNQIKAVASGLVEHCKNHNDTNVGTTVADFQKIVDELAAEQADLRDRIINAGKILNG